MLLSLILASIGDVSASYVNVSLDGFPAKSLAGYIDVTHGSLFYWLVKQTSCACKAPVIIWLNGGPGSASTGAALFENGPAAAQSDGSLADTSSTSWNNFANMVYLDQPVGAGYSTISGDGVSNTSDAAGDFVEFLKGFYEQFPKLKDNPLHIAGESYAGRYIPTFVEKYMSDSSRPRDVSSIMLGNAQVSYSDIKWSVPDMFCGLGGMSAVLDDGNCTLLENEKDGCLSVLQTCIADQDSYLCYNLDSQNCTDIEAAPSTYHSIGGNPYHLGTQCEDSTLGLCYSQIDNVQTYLNSSATKRALGVDESISFDLNGQTVNENWDYLDMFWDGSSQVASLLEAGVNTLVYSGDQDGICPWIGAKKWSSNMTWSGADEYHDALQVPSSYIVDGASAGDVSTSGPLTFLRVFGSGHMVPLNVPRVAYQMARDWVYHQQL